MGSRCRVQAMTKVVAIGATVVTIAMSNGYAHRVAHTTSRLDIFC